MFIHIVEGNLFYSFHQLHHYSHPETPSQKHPEIMFNLSTLFPYQVETKLTITVVSDILKVSCIYLIITSFLFLELCLSILSLFGGQTYYMFYYFTDIFKEHFFGFISQFYYIVFNLCFFI